MVGEGRRNVPYTRTNKKCKRTQERSLLQTIAAQGRGELSHCVRTVIEGEGNREMRKVPGKKPEMRYANRTLKKNA